MSIRPAMQTLINSLRSMAQVSTTFYTLENISYFTDQHLQDVLDQYSIIHDFEDMEPFAQRSGAVYAYKIYDTHVQHWEGTPVITDSVGTTISSGFTFNSTTGRCTFTNDQAGSVRTFSGTAYDMNAAAADMWNRKAAYYADAYDVTTDNHNLSRSQLIEHARERAQYYAMKAHGGGCVYTERSDT